MKILISLLLLGFMLNSCSDSTVKDTQQQPFMNPIVQKWLNDPETKAETENKLPVLVTVTEPIQEYDFLKKITETSYTGHITREQLKTLLKDQRIKRISSSKEELHK
ncbi:MAG: hypothetical protein JXR46_02085 [Calditrichaceae bacterium]|nr:hypothetical protein [Calditrichaceae bacterium]MBN2707810.1 hypothetical protein [Calditrichaceae bacterium]RQV96265.1 MAG: hypothetical protein EH224_04870 [Calditrichota bacterium]